MNERGVLQGVVGVLAIVPVLAGTAGIAGGPGLVGVDPPWGVDLDSHFRFLSGVLLAMGLAWWSCVPGIEAKGERFRLLAGLTMLGGLGRLLSLGIAGAPSLGHQVGLVIELIAVPVLVIWQMRVARIHRWREARAGAI
ncbi:MAG: DUF4345 domain-containing protein [Methylobacterium mesophilicum]|nr:DUF4345 domain-containing protein [Methylobacterium mesophilicum]